MASMETVEVNEEGLQALSRTWGVLLFTGLLSIVIGIMPSLSCWKVCGVSGQC